LPALPETNNLKLYLAVIAKPAVSAELPASRMIAFPGGIARSEYSHE
jgi:hypothetical protein